MLKQRFMNTLRYVGKVFLSTILLFGVGGVSVCDGKNLPLQVLHLQITQIDPTIEQGGEERSPMRAPKVYLDDHTVDVSYVWFDSTLRLLDSNDDVVYTTFVPAYTPTVILPSNLDGTLQIQFLWNNWCFYGWITLYSAFP